MTIFPAERTPTIAPNLQPDSLKSKILNLASSKATGKLKLQPSGVTIHFQNGLVEAVEGVEPLGVLVFRQGWVAPEQIESCLLEAGPLGQALLKKGLIDARQLKTVLNTQARVGLGYAMQLQKQTSEWRAENPNHKVLGAEFLVDIYRLQTVENDVELPLNHPIRMAEASSGFPLTQNELILLRSINGRRTLWSAMRQCSLNLSESTLAAKGLLSKGLLEPSALHVLRTITPQRLPMDSGKQPPSSIVGNLFLKSIDGTMNVAQISSKLRIQWEEAALILASLHRDRLIHILSGQKAMEKLLEEY